MVDLCWKLALVMKGQAKPELLDTYGADRLPVIKSVLTKTEGLTHAIGSENTLFRSVFNHIAPVAGKHRTYPAQQYGTDEPVVPEL